MSDLASEFVSAVFSAISGVAALTEADREAAKAAVAAKLDEISRVDPGALKPRADTIRAKHLAAMAVRHGLDESTMRVMTPPQVVAAADAARALLDSTILSHEHRDALATLIAHGDPLGEHERRMQRSEDDTSRTPLAGPDQ